MKDLDKKCSKNCFASEAFASVEWGVQIHTMVHPAKPRQFHDGYRGKHMIALAI
jgi:hypothetical protein